MRVNLTSGVDATLITTQQFKTTRIIISFLKQIESKKELAMRTLLANILETSSQKYPTQKQVAQKLAALYGASFGTTSNRHGNVHALNMILNCVNDKYLQKPQEILKQALEFLEEMLFAPLVDENGFDQKTFMRQKSNLEDYLVSLADNKQTLAALKVQELYFTKSWQQVASFGSQADLKNITAQELYAYYLQCLTKDQVQIVVLGDLVSETKIQELLQNLPFVARTSQNLQPFYTQEVIPTVKETSDSEELSQSKLDLMFNLPVKYHTKDHYAALVLNGLFGGSPLSKLFVNVREKESLAYYASSSLDILRQTILVQTGIQAENKEHVVELIIQQLQAIAKQDFSLEVFENVKASLVNSYLSRLDSQMNLVNRVISDYLTNTVSDEAKWVANIKEVTPQEVANLATKIKLQAVYFLEGRG